MVVDCGGLRRIVGVVPLGPFNKMDKEIELQNYELMEKELKFEKNERGLYEAKFVSEGKTTIHVERKTLGAVSVLGNLTGLDPTLIETFKNNEDKGLAFIVDLPVGMEVTLRCGYEVTRAKMMTEN